MTREIPLTRGYVALVDDDDFALVGAVKWHALVTRSGRVYAKRSVRAPDGYRDVLMHRVLMGATPGVEVDHIEGVGLDNRRANLRLASHQQNLCNRTHPTRSRSGYRGVAPHRDGRWRAYVNAHGRQHAVGVFSSAEEAARARDAAAIRLSGEFATRNFPAGGLGAQEAGRLAEEVEARSFAPKRGGGR